MTSILNFPHALPRLTGEPVYLRELTEDDIPAWFQYVIGAPP